jgi:hypothetical protein
LKSSARCKVKNIKEEQHVLFAFELFQANGLAILSRQTERWGRASYLNDGKNRPYPEAQPYKSNDQTSNDSPHNL